jgi:hypothetical protein
MIPGERSKETGNSPACQRQNHLLTFSHRLKINLRKERDHPPETNPQGEKNNLLNIKIKASCSEELPLTKKE